MLIGGKIYECGSNGSIVFVIRVSIDQSKRVKGRK